MIVLIYDPTIHQWVEYLDSWDIKYTFDPKEAEQFNDNAGIDSSYNRFVKWNEQENNSHLFLKQEVVQ